MKMLEGAGATANGRWAEIDRSRGLDWVDRLRAGDQTAFRDVYENFHPRVHAFIRRRLHGSADSDDLTQETFLQLFLSIDTFEGGASLLTWTLGIAQNVCRRYFRTGSRWMVNLRDATTLGDVPCDQRIESRLDATLILSRCTVVLQTRRRPAHQEIFKLRYSERQSVRAIAKRLGRSNDSVKSSLKRSRSVLTTSIPDLETVLDEVARIA